MKNHAALFQQLKKWMEQPQNSPALLSSKLGYRSSNTVYKWVQRGVIPPWRHDDIKRAMEECNADAR